MHVQSMTTLTHSVQSGAPRRPLARLAVVAIALLTCAVAGAQGLPQQQLSVAFTNAFPNGSLDALTMPNPIGMPNSAAIVATDPLLTGGTPQNLYTALVWVTNPITGTLDLIYADAEQHKIWRLPGPLYKNPVVIFSWSGKGSGPPYPVGLAADPSGNVYAISPSSAWDKPGVWVLPITATGTYGAPLLIDTTFDDPVTHKPVSTLALTEVAVAGTAASGGSPAWNALDLLVLIADPFNTRVIRYSQTQIQSVLSTKAVQQGPASNIVTPAQFLTQATNKIPPIPVGMDVGQDPTTQDMTLLLATIDGRILDFDSAKNAFITPYAINLGLGVTRVRVATFQGAQYVFVAQLPGRIMEFASPASGHSNTTPFASVTKGVSNPSDLAVTRSGSTTASTSNGNCISAPCMILPQLSLQFTGPGTANFPANASIAVASCTGNDPRVTSSDGVTSYNPVPLNLGAICPDPQLSNVYLSNNVFGGSGPTGNAIYVAKITAPALNKFSTNTSTTPVNNTLTHFVLSPGAVLGTNPPCGTANGPVAAWGPLPLVESTTPELLEVPGATSVLFDITVACTTDPPPAGNSNHPSIVIEGTVQGGLTAPYIDGEFSNLQQAFTNDTTQINGGIQPSIQGYITNSLNYFNQQNQQGYNCALNTLYNGAQYIYGLVNTPATSGDFTAGAPPAADENPSGTLLMRFDHLYYDVNIYAGNAPITTDALNLPANSVPSCAPASSTLMATNPYMFELASNDTPAQPSNSPGTTQVISWTITGTTEACSLADSNNLFTSQFPNGVTGTGSYDFSYNAGTIFTPGIPQSFPQSVTWTLSCPELPQATAQYWVDSPGVLSMSLAEGSNTEGDGADVTLTWNFSDFPSGTQCSLSSTDPTFPGYPNGVTVSISASTPYPYIDGGGPGSFNTGTVGTSDPLTSGTGNYQYSQTGNGTFTATLTCNGITSSTSYEIAE